MPAVPEPLGRQPRVRARRRPLRRAPATARTSTSSTTASAAGRRARGTPKNPCGDPPAAAGDDRRRPPRAARSAARSVRTHRLIRRASTARSCGSTRTRARACPATRSPGAADANARRILAYGLRNPFRFDVPARDERALGRRRRLDRPGRRSTGSPTPTDGARRRTSAGRATRATAGSAATTAPTWTCARTLYAQGTGGRDGARLRVPPRRQGRRRRDLPDRHGSSTTGLAFYPATGGSFPAAYRGGLFFADHSRNCIWFDAQGLQRAARPVRPEAFVGRRGEPGRPRDRSRRRSVLRRLRGRHDPPDQYTAGTSRRSRSSTPTPTIGSAPAHRRLRRERLDPIPRAAPLTYAWDLDGDGEYDDATDVDRSWTYTDPGDVTVSLGSPTRSRVSDTDSQVINVGNDRARPGRSTPRRPRSSGTSATWCPFSGSPTDAQDGNAARRRR